MQEISENLLAQGTMNVHNQLAKGRPVPEWFSEMINYAQANDKAWWHVYLDNFAAGERVIPEKPSTWGEHVMKQLNMLGSPRE